ncbi:MAG: LLM class flavin-dependent oxidoreductase [Actinomycetota bacterium]|jgi:alkanesulfonate monooxygenase SsuD/methylene tetrahydromethanopterin reductase-like flavin-dependent oxidoreductase (luciferase family)|nr:LLM class flavin-dependent oxidoreductase [Actinomycetota bacterium]
MAFSLGVHLGQQNSSMDELRGLWRRFDEGGLDWLSAWDHLYEAPPADGLTPHFEAVATLAAMAADTKQIRLGCLMFCVPYRNAALLAKAAVAIDHISGGRFEIGVGAGWHEPEFVAHGYEFGTWGQRFDMLTEGLEILQGMFTQDRTTFHGEHYQVEDVTCVPGPVRGRIPIWIGGRGPKRTPDLAARYADGYNVPYVSTEQFRELSERIDRACEAHDRDPASIERTVNLSFNLSTTEAAAQREQARFDAMPEDTRENMMAGSLQGTPDMAAERIYEYAEAGATGLNIALRLPVDNEALDAYLENVVPQVREAL